MHALVNQGNGKYYVSYVFGYYTDITATDEYERYVQSIHSPYFIVWDENKQKLIKWLRMVPIQITLFNKLLLSTEIGIIGLSMMKVKVASIFLVKK